MFFFRTSYCRKLKWFGHGISSLTDFSAVTASKNASSLLKNWNTKKLLRCILCTSYLPFISPPANINRTDIMICVIWENRPGACDFNNVRKWQVVLPRPRKIIDFGVFSFFPLSHLCTIPKKLRRHVNSFVNPLYVNGYVRYFNT